MGITVIDLHCHILWNMDDGATSFTAALEMARLAAADGVRIIAATPHSPDSFGSRRYDIALIRAQIEQLNAAIQAEGLELEIITGTEIAYAGRMAERLRSGALLSYGNTQTVLLEPPYGRLPSTFETAVFGLQVAGYRILLAHPERVPDIQENPNRLIPLIERGVLMQITAEALTGEQGERMQHIATTLLTHGMAHVIASDSHGPPPERPPLLSAARARAMALIGPAAAAMLVDATPQALITGQPFTPPAPRPASQHFPRRGWF